NVAIGKDRTSKLVTPPPSTPKTKPPKEAPAIPKMMVMIERPGSGPGTIRLATTPAMAPMTIQLMIPIAFLLVRLFRVLLGSLEAGDWMDV
ncbi:MAG TPA: hypothetical protein VK902_17335, partial [Rubrobacter sp.]|nr:hypothetical protein [Rubrobacter sp.]